MSTLALNKIEMIALLVDVWQLLCGLGLFLSPGPAASKLFTWMILLVNVGSSPSGSCSGTSTRRP